MFICQVIANVFFGGNPSSVLHIILTVVIVAAATLVSLLIDCLGIVLELNVSTRKDLLHPFKMFPSMQNVLPFFLKYHFLKYSGNLFAL